MALKTRSLCLFLALLLGVLPLCACAQNTVLSYRGVTLDERLFSYALTLTKTKMLSTLTGTTQNLTDDPSIWTTDLGDGETYADVALENTLKTMKMTLFYAAYAKEEDLVLGKEEKESAKENVENIVSSFGSRDAFDSYMSGYGFDYDLILSYYELDALSQLGMRSYYNHPLTSLTQADVQTYYEENYVTAVYLYVNETDVTLQNGKTVPLDEAEKKERTAFFEAAKKGIESGKPFSDYLEKSDAFSHEEGEADTFLLSSVSPIALQTALKEATENELFEVKAAKGRYLVRKEALSESFLEKNSDALLLKLISDREDALLESEDGFVLNEAYFASLDIANLAVF